MLTAKSFEQTLKKLTRFSETLYDRIFHCVGQAENVRLYETTVPLHEIPDESLFKPADGKARWGGEGVYGWFKFEYTVPESLDGKALFLYPRTEAYEGTLWVNGKMHSNFAAKFVEGSHGNHYCNRFTACAKKGETFSFALENYAFHDMPGTQPLFYESFKDYTYPISSMDICVRDDELMEFCFDLKTLLSLRNALPETSFRRAEVENALMNAHRVLYYDPAACTQEEFASALKKSFRFL